MTIRNHPIQGNNGRIRRIHINGLDHQHRGTTDCVTPFFGSILPCQLLGGRGEPEVGGCSGLHGNPKEAPKKFWRHGKFWLMLWKFLNEIFCWEGKQNGQIHSQWFCRWVYIILNMPQTGGFQFRLVWWETITYCVGKQNPLKCFEVLSVLNS